MKRDRNSLIFALRKAVAEDSYVDPDRVSRTIVDSNVLTGAAELLRKEEPLMPKMDGWTLPHCMKCEGVLFESYKWFIYDSDDKLIGYGDPDNWDELVGFGTYLTLHCKDKHGYHNFKSLKAVKRFIRNCEAIKKGQSIVIRVSRYVGYKDIRITK